ncbi:MAG: hypothetical protein CL583_01110 [Alteromonadaceae bacterium]|nr:hypothetical protein [Alteromonadaceae bacterium]|tara:strand:+ start:1166 stop:2338 length:1173 start_codon:yes stop_codon:yes gene_type:complete
MEMRSLEMHHKKRKVFWILGVVVVLLVIVRVALPSYLQRYVNQTLDSAEGYSGQVGDIDLAIWRGAYVINDVEINKAAGDVYAPFFSAEEIDLSILMPALFRGHLVGEILLQRPTLNIVITEDPEKADEEMVPKSFEQTGEPASWQQILTELFPLRFDLVEIRQGEIHYRKPDSDPRIDLYLTNLDAELVNFTNSRELSESMVATLTATADVMRNGSLDFTLEMDPYKEPPYFDFKGKLLNLEMTSIDDFIRVHTPIDLEAGSLDLVVELAARAGRLTGYIKPLLRNVEVFDWDEDVEEQGDNVLRMAWEGVVGGITELFENQPRDQVATRIPVDGDLSGPQPELFTSIINILRNAFVNAFEADLDGDVQPPEPRSGSDPQPEGETETGQ